MSQINLNAVLNFDDSQFKKGIKSTQQELKRFSTAPAFIKLKLDEGDFRKGYQELVKDLRKKIEKSGALSYKTASGKTRIADTEKAMEKAYTYNLQQSTNDKLSTAEKNAYAKRAEYMRQYLNLLKEIGLETSRQAEIERARANASVRMEKARISGAVEAERRRAASAARLEQQEIERKRREAAIDTPRAYRQAYGVLDRERNRFAAGGNSNSVLADMRRFYQQQEAEIKRLEQRFLGQGTILGKLGRLASRYFSVYTIMRFGQKVAEITGYFEQQKVALEGILGSSTKARSVLNDIYSFALKSPFQTKELVQFTKQLSAFGITGDELFPTVKELADISAGLGVDMSRIILAYGQVKSASVLRGQELRQFTEAGIPMVEELAKKFTALNGETVRTADIFDMISKRQVSFEMVADVLSDMTKEGGKFYKMQENVTNTLYGQIQKLKDLWTLSIKDMGDGTKGVLNGIVKLLQVIVENAKSIVIALGAAFSGAYIYKAISGLSEVNNKVRAYIRLLDISAKARKLAYGGLIGAGIGIATGIIAKVIENARELKRAFDSIEESFSKENSKMLKGLDSLSKKIQTSAIGTKEFSDAVGTLAHNYGDFVSNDIIKALNSQSDAAIETARSFGSIADSIKSAILEYNKYQELQEKKDVAKDKVYNKRLGNRFFTGFSGKHSLMMLAGKDVKEMYNRNITINEIEEEFKSTFEDAMSEFASGDTFTEEKFNETITRVFKEQFPSMTDDALSEIFREGWEAYQSNYRSKKAIKAIEDLNSKEQYSLYYRQRHYLESVNPSKDVYYDGKDLIAYNDNLEAAYIRALQQTLNDAPKEIKNAITDDFSKLLMTSYTVDAETGLISATDAFDSGTISRINDFLDKLKNTLTDESAKNWLVGVSNLFNEKTEEKNGRAAKVSELIKNNEEYRNHADEAVKALWLRFNPKDEDYEQKRKDVEKEYKELKGELDSYVSKGGKDSGYIKTIEDKIAALRVLASKEYFNIVLDNDKDGSNAQTLPTAISDLINNLKTAYTRYKEATQKGGVDLGLDYVRTNRYFQDTFGAFFSGAESNKFKEIASLKIGDKSVGDLLKDKFLSDKEEGILGFHDALKALQEQLESYGKADKENRKAYLNAAKALNAWIDETFSKDNLSAVMLQLENEMKILTNSFEKTNKVIDLYRQLQEKGNTDLAGKLGVSEIDALAPSSTRVREQFNKYINAYNSYLPESAVGFSAGPLSDIGDVYEALEQLEKVTELNNAFGVEGIGTQAGEEAKRLLKQLLETLIQEAVSISGEVYSGNAMQDLVANAKKRYDSLLFSTTKQENVARSQGTYDWGAIKAMVNATQEEAKVIFDQFMKDNRFDILAKQGDGRINDTVLGELEEKLMKIAKDLPQASKDELLSKLTNLRSEVDKYNASIGAYGTFTGAIQSYRGADDYASSAYTDEWLKNEEIQQRIGNKELLGLSAEDIDELNTQLNLSNERLEAMGEDGKILAEELKKASLENLQKSIQECQNQFSSMVDVVNSVVNATKALSNAINKVYDIMNDGENPEWMQEMDGFLSDFGDAFEAIIAPITAVIALVSALAAAAITLDIAFSPLLIIMAAVIAVAAVIAGVIAAFQAHDRKLERTIKNLNKEIEATQNAITNINAAAERMVGLEKQESVLKSLANTYELYKDAMKQARLEDDKHNTDPEKLKDYMQNAQQYLDEFLNGIHDWREEILFGVEDLAGSITDALRSAFQNGSNAAREAASVIKQSIGDMIWNMLQLTVVEPMIQNAMEEFFGGTAEQLQDRFTVSDGNGGTKFDYKKALDYFANKVNDEETMKGLEATLNAITTGTIDTINSFSEQMKDYMSYNPETSSLSGGISGITEDTARTLEGLQNSMLMQMIMANQYLADFSSSGFAQVQTSWFNDMLQQSRSMRDTTERIEKAINDMRDIGSRSLRVTMA